MRVWEQRLNQYYDEIADYASDWPELISMVEAMPQTEETLPFLEDLIVRIKPMNRRFNRVNYKVVPDAPNYWEIANYTYKMYAYFKQKYPEHAVITPRFIRIISEVVEPKDQELLRKQL